MFMIPRLARAILALLASLAPFACAAGEPARPADTIVVGVEMQSYLPAYAVENGRYVGYARDVLDAFAKDAGYRLEYRPLPVPRLYAAFFAGQVDLKFPDNPTWQAERRAGHDIVYSEPLAAFVDGISVVPTRRGAGPATLRTLGTVSGFTPWAAIDLVRAGKVALTENTSLDGLLQQVQTGRIDGVYASIAVVNHQLDHVLRQPGALVFDPSLPHSRGQYHVASIKRPDVVRDLTAWLRNNAKRVAAMKAAHAVEKGVPQP